MWLRIFLSEQCLFDFKRQADKRKRSKLGEVLVDQARVLKMTTSFLKFYLHLDFIFLILETLSFSFRYVISMPLNMPVGGLI